MAVIFVLGVGKLGNGMDRMDLLRDGLLRRDRGDQLREGIRMRAPRRPAFRSPLPERRDADRQAIRDALAWGSLILTLVILSTVAMLWWMP